MRLLTNFFIVCLFHQQLYSDEIILGLGSCLDQDYPQPIWQSIKKESLENAVFTINDSLTYSFEIDSYIHLAYPENLPVVLCPQGDKSGCIILDFSETEDITYISLSKNKESTKTSLKAVTESKGEFDYYKVEKKQDKRGVQKPIYPN